MIEAVQEWLRAVVVTALLLSVVQTLLPEGNVRRIASFSGGLILMLVLLRPLLGTDLSALELDLAPYREAIEERQAELEAESDQELEQLIAERTVAYILEEAGQAGHADSGAGGDCARRRRYAGSGESGNHGGLFRTAVGVDCAGAGNSRGGAGLA